MDPSALVTSHRRRLVRTSGIATLANIALLAISVLDTIVTARLLGAGRKGSLFLLTTAVSTIALVVGGSLGTAFQVATTQGRVALGAAARTSILVAVGSGVVALPLAVAAGGLSFLHGLAVPGALLIPAELTVLLLTPLFVSADRVGRRSLIEVSAAFLDLGLTAGFILTGGDRLFRAVLGVVVARWLFAVVLAADLWNRGSKPNEPRWRRRALSFGLRQHPGNVLARAAKRADAFLLAGFLGSKAVGVYSVASTLAEIPLFVARAIQPSIVTFTAALGRTSAIEVARAARVVVAGYAVALPVYGAICAPMIAPALGQDFGEAVAPFWLLLLPTACLAAYLVLMGYFVGDGRPGLVTLVIGIPFALNLALSLILIPTHGLVGDALASVAGGVATVALAFALFRKHTEIPTRALFVPQRSDISVVAQSLRASALTVQETEATTP